MNVKSFHLGYFLKKSYVVTGFKLLEKQIREKSFQFRCIDLELYRKEKYLQSFEVGKFYKVYIEKDLLYNYPSYFYTRSYPYPKTRGGLRKFFYSSFGIQILYYSIGIYLLDVCDSLEKEIQQYRGLVGNVFTFYGGAIDLTDSYKSQIFYQGDYKRFLEKKEQFSRIPENGKKVLIIKLDVKEYFHSIHHKKLLQIIEQYSHPSSRKVKHFDSSARESILNLLSYILGEEKGLPLSRQNIVSNALAHKYLYPLDDYVLKLKENVDGKLNYIRYVDDFFIFIQFPNGHDNQTIGERAEAIVDHLSDFLLKELGLELNGLKTQIHILRSEEDQKYFLREDSATSMVNSEEFVDIDWDEIIDLYESAKPLSPIEARGETEENSHIEPATLEGVTSSLEKEKKAISDPNSPPNRLAIIIAILTELKEGHQRGQFPTLIGEKKQAVNDAFGKRMKEYLKSTKASEQLRDLFKDWPASLTTRNVKAILFLIQNAPRRIGIITKFLKNGLKDSTHSPTFLLLLEHYLLGEKNSVKLNELISLEKGGSDYFKIIQRLVKPRKDDFRADIPISDIILDKNDALLQQLKLMRLAERTNTWNVAFNHMLNVFHYFCYAKFRANSPTMLKDYNRTLVQEDLSSQFAYKGISFISSVFDRRNKNTISHPGEEDMAYWPLDYNEYARYKKDLFTVIKHINNNTRPQSGD